MGRGLQNYTSLGPPNTRQGGEVLQTLLQEDANLETQLQLQLDKQLCTAQPCNCKECATAKLSLRQLLHTATRLNPITRLLPATKITNLTVNTNTVPQSQLTRWRRWTPSELTKQPMQLQISMEQTLTARWRANITLFLLPWANYIPTLAAEAASTTGTPQGHWLGKNRWGTIRAKTILLQKLAKIGHHPMPPTPDRVGLLLTALGQTGPTQGKIKAVWHLYAWLAKYGDIRPILEAKFLNSKVAAMRYDIQTHHIKYRKQSVPIPKQAVSALETASITAKTMPDRVAAATFRHLVGSSARANDGQHTAPETLHETAKTVELTAWQTKVSSTTDDSARPMPLISTKHSLTGHAWWETFTTYLKTATKQDYLLPAPTRDRTRFRDVPATSQQLLRWLRAILADQGIDDDTLSQITLGSMRVWMPDLAYQAGVARDRRRYLGRWAFDTTADVYTREHRAVVHDIWEEVLQKMPQLKDNTTAFPESDLEEDIETFQANQGENHAKGKDSPPTKSTGSQIRTHCDEIPRKEGGPGQLILTRKRAPGKPPKLHIQLLTGTTVGCGWKPSPLSIHTLTAEEDYNREKTQASPCDFCFRRFTVPKGWDEITEQEDSSSDESENSATSAADSDSEDD